MTCIITTHYRRKPPPRKRKAVPLEAPAVVTPKRKRELLPAERKQLEPASPIVQKAKPCNDNRPDPAPHDNDVAKAAIVTVRRRGKRFADVPDMTPEEHKRRGYALRRRSPIKPNPINADPSSMNDGGSGTAGEPETISSLAPSLKELNVVSRH